MRKCAHDVYWPDKDAIAYSCQQCNPDGTGDGPTPVLPRSSSDPLTSDKSDKVETCEKCGNIRTYFSKECRFCNHPFPITTNGRQQATANIHQAGTCPACGSTIHFDLGNGKWECCDCGVTYPGVKRKKHGKG